MQQKIDIITKITNTYYVQLYKYYGVDKRTMYIGKGISYLVYARRTFELVLTSSYTL